MNDSRLAWVSILRDAGYPTEVVLLDWETYFDDAYSLKKLSTIEYIEDPRFEEIGVACLLRSGQQPFAPIEPHFWTDVQGQLAWLRTQYGEDLERCTVMWKNGRFDGTILVRKWGIMPPFTVDVQDLANHVDCRVKNSLAGLCKRYGLKDKGDTMQFKGWHGPNCRRSGGPPRLFKQVMDEDMLRAMSEYSCNDAVQEWNLLKILLPKLTRPEVELRVMQQTHRLFWEPCLKINVEEAERLMADMDAEIDRASEAVGLTRNQLSGNKSFVAELDKALGPDESVPMKLGKKGMIPALAKTDAGLLRLKKHPSSRVRDLIDARQSVKSWPLHIARLKRIVAQAQAAGGLLPVPLHYHGAHTGRWTGGERINLQNLSARNPDPLMQRIRQVIEAPEGHLLVVADASQIEARITAWIAGQWDLVTAFEAGEEIYCQFAAEVLGRPVRKAQKTDPKMIAAWYTAKRNMGKVGVLGCGYGMGSEKCQNYAKHSYGVNLSEAEAKNVVNHYREKYPHIVRFWSKIEQAFKYVTKYPGHECDLDRGLHFRNEDDCTFITLPCGRDLRYPHARVTSSGKYEQLSMPNPKEHTTTYMWGGYLTENIVQAMSRDLLAEAMLMLEDGGAKIGLHVHDEIVVVARADDAERILRLMLAALETPVAWAPGLPLAAEGRICVRYGK